MGAALTVRLAIGAGAIASMLASAGAKAATLTLVGTGTSASLTSNFNPSNFAAINADGIHNGTSITYFTGIGNTGGLFVSPGDVNITFEYMGKEAAYLNETIIGGSLGTFTTSQTPIQTTGALHFSFGSSPSAVPFLFLTVGGGNIDAINGGAVANGLRIAFAKVNSSEWYALFDDGGAGPDHDYDDMVLRITASDVPHGPSPTPLPGAVWLLGTVIAGGTGSAYWRKRRAGRGNLS